jgi:hypothetical protein
MNANVAMATNIMISKASAKDIYKALRQEGIAGCISRNEFSFFQWSDMNFCIIDNKDVIKNVFKVISKLDSIDDITIEINNADYQNLQFYAGYRLMVNCGMCEYAYLNNDINYGVRQLLEIDDRLTMEQNWKKDIKQHILSYLDTLTDMYCDYTNGGNTKYTVLKPVNYYTMRY